MAVRANGRTSSDGPGWTVVALLFACGVALGSLITRSPIQSRVPGGMRSKVPAGSGFHLPPSLPSLLPFYAAALAFPLFMLLARRLPLSRATWQRALPLWLAVVAVASVLPDIVLLVLVGGPGPFNSSVAYLLALRALNTAPLVIGVAALAHTVEQRRRARAIAIEAETARAELAQAQLRALSGQLRPHFLFNTLQSISTLVHRDAAAADNMIGKLGDLLRASLDLGDRPLIPLDEELRLARTYLDIMRERFGERLDVSVESTAAAGVLVPPFLLQPLVENAVQHGIEPALGSGYVRVLAHSEGTDVILEVKDSGRNGRGSSKEGVGLSNVRQRLAALFDERARLTIDSDPSQGTRVTVRIPRVYSPDR